MITRLNQWLCTHDYETMTTYGIDDDLYRLYGIKREVPKFSADRCKKCQKQIEVKTKTYVWMFNKEADQKT